MRIDWLTNNGGNSGNDSVSRFLPSFFRGVAPDTPPDAIRWPLIMFGLAWSAALGALFAISARLGANRANNANRASAASSVRRS